MRSGPKAQNVIAQGNALVACEANDQSPNRGDMIKNLSRNKIVFISRNALASGLYFSIGTGR